MMMDNVGGPAQNHIGQINSANSSNFNSVQNKSEEGHSRPNYTIPGILHFIQHEWARFEMERAQWEVEKAEFQARIAFLQGERKGQENLKRDLVRRIKMLEYALRQERAKFQRLKSGHDTREEIKPPTFDGEEGGEEETALSPNNQINFKQSRQLLRQYLQEIGYTDTILDVRSNRVRSLLGLAPNDQNIPGLETNGQGGDGLVNGDSPVKPSRQADQVKRKTEKNNLQNALPDTVLDNVLSCDFLPEDEDIDNDLEDSAVDSGDERGKMSTLIKKKKVMGNEGMAGMEEAFPDPETEDALNEFNFLNDSQEGAGEAQTSGDWAPDKKGDMSPTSGDWHVDQGMLKKLKEDYKKARGKGNKYGQRPSKAVLQDMLSNLGGEEPVPPPSSTSSSSPPSRPRPVPGIDLTDEPDIAPGARSEGSRPPIMAIGDEESIESALGLGELAGLTITNEADVLTSGYNQSSANREAFRKTWTPKYTLRSHFDGVRSLAFHPEDTVLITGSEDHTLKLWNLQKTVPAKKAVSLDVEPIYTFRGHVGPVLCVAVDSSGEHCFSGGTDAAIRCWNLPDSNLDPYDSYNPNVLADTFVGHTNAVWELEYDGTKNHLLSSSGDGTVRLWNPQNKSPLLNTYTAEDADLGAPTSIDFVRCDTSQVVVGYTSADAVVYDLETGKPILTLDGRTLSESANAQINRVVSHPTLPITITAHEDRHIRFFDNTSGKMVHSMVAHLDAVTCLAVDPNGLYLLSGSHDCSIRLWNLDSKTCVQEITSHRKKFDESIFDVAFHPSKPYIASGGADALAKVFI
ncbi:striatin-3-like [Apostichopus japonicus]|uniref:striatin-3-like n=1 Tax=Stichopus japonicus TaxID=307972 RepID=UPI003AB6BD8A